MDKAQNVILTDNPRLTEREFLLREFDIKLVSVNPMNKNLHKLIMGLDIPCIASTNVFAWSRLFKSLPSSSISFLLLGNETYDVDLYRELARQGSIKHAFIYGLPKNGRFINSFGGSIGELIDSDSFSFSELLQCARNLRTGLLKREQFKTVSFPFETTSFPQGYSQSFAIQISRAIKNLDQRDSLLNSELVREFFKNEKSFKFGFVGQAGSKRRKWVVNYAHAKCAGLYEFKDNYGGNNQNPDDSYVTMLKATQFSLVPPGAFNSHNHRYLEALIAGCLPLIVSNVSTDGFENSNWTKNMPFTQRYSYRKLIDFIFDLSEEDTYKLVEHFRLSELTRIKEEIELVKKALHTSTL
jgi:hypothetical protein